ncbi:hypothetical protein IBB66_10305 [Listeria innocua]|nr:hypothetical protein [Listeria innocua]MBF2443363.1 hypothetical protein [Listeria innocua]MBF2661711.1 hypothetical protein [Listeria innocua]
MIQTFSEVHEKKYSLVIRNLKEVIVDYCKSVEEIDKTAANAVSKGV